MQGRKKRSRERTGEGCRRTDRGRKKKRKEKNKNRGKENDGERGMYWQSVERGMYWQSVEASKRSSHKLLPV